MGQQPNIELEMADLPRPTHHPQAPRRWAPDRPADLRAPGDVPWGGHFGTPGPDGGYALRLLAELDIPIGPGEKKEDAAAALAALMAARASYFGRAAVAADADVAQLILGYGSDVPDGLAERRAAALAGLAHRPAAARALAASVDVGLLTAPSDEVRRRTAAGEFPFGLR